MYRCDRQSGLVGGVYRCDRQSGLGGGVSMFRSRRLSAVAFKVELICITYSLVNLCCIHFPCIVCRVTRSVVRR